MLHSSDYSHPWSPLVSNVEKQLTAVISAEKGRHVRETNDPDWSDKINDPGLRPFRLYGSSISYFDRQLLLRR